MEFFLGLVATSVRSNLIICKIAQVRRQSNSSSSKGYQFPQWPSPYFTLLYSRLPLYCIVCSWNCIGLLYLYLTQLTSNLCILFQFHYCSSHTHAAVSHYINMLCLIVPIPAHCTYVLSSHCCANRYLRVYYEHCCQMLRFTYEYYFQSLTWHMPRRQDGTCNLLQLIFTRMYPFRIKCCWLLVKERSHLSLSHTPRQFVAFIYFRIARFYLYFLHCD